MGTMDTLAYIIDKYSLEIRPKGPTEIPNTGRDDLPELFRELGYNRGAEIGVQRGLYSEVLCEGLPGADLFFVDAWKAYRGYREKVTQAHMDRFWEEAQQRLQPYACTIIQAFSMEAVQQFEDASLDFVYIDANHMIPWVIDDICAWRKKVRSGGIVAGHDYYASKRINTIIHVTYAVHCVIQSYRIHPWFVVGLRRELPGRTRDPSRSWFWVR